MNLKVSKIETLAAVDGGGIRCAIFFQGCPLSCVCCHNPETRGAVGGVEYTPSELLKKVLRLKPYFNRDGGVTLTGGEPLMSLPEIADLAKMFCDLSIDICLDTSGYRLDEEAKKLINYCSLIILDLKYPNKEMYETFVGGCDIEVVKNFAIYCLSQGKKLWLRTVIIPNINDTESHIEEYAKVAIEIKHAVLDCYRDNFERYELLAFHTMGFGKYERLGIKNPLIETGALEESKLDQLQKSLDNILNANRK